MIVRKKLEINVPEAVRDIAEIFTHEGFKAYLVGGAVRDALLGEVPKDFDLATNARPDEVIRLLRGQYELLEVGKSFGVVIAKDGEDEYEIATFRKDIGEGRRPDRVEFTTIENDVLRRDLTINALFYDLDLGEVVDHVGGIADLENLLVRAVGDPKERFREDRLRIMRAFRFAARLGGEFDDATARAIWADNSLRDISPERIRDEFLKGLISAQSPRQYFEKLGLFQMWDYVFPGLDVTGIFDTKNVPVLLAVMLKENEPTNVSHMLNTMKYTTNEARGVLYLQRFSELCIENAYTLMRMRPHYISDGDLKEFAQLAGMKQKKFIEAFFQFMPTVSGQALLDEGFSGMKLGEELRRRETQNFVKLLVGP